MCPEPYFPVIGQHLTEVTTGPLPVLAYNAMGRTALMKGKTRMTTPPPATPPPPPDPTCPVAIVVSMRATLFVAAVLVALVSAPTAAAQDCDPNYSGCVPKASDVDCAGGSGNGPAYVSGPVRVIVSDIYGLDRDGDGVACE